mgnify:CR=1 FL=1
MRHASNRLNAAWSVTSAGVGRSNRYILPDVHGLVLPGIGHMDEMPGLGKHAFSNDRVNMGMPVNQIAECLRSTDHSRYAVFGIKLKPVDIADRLPGRRLRPPEEG